MRTDDATHGVHEVVHRLRPMLEGRRVVLTGGPLAAMPPRLAQVRQLGALRPLCVARGLGTGPLPDEDEADVLLLDTGTHDVIAELREESRLLSDPPADLRAALDRYDPDRTAVVLVGQFHAGREVAGRRVLDGRLPAWEALEDKTTVDALWDDLGVAHAPAAVVPAREGFNGGAEYVRWVRSRVSEERALSFFAEHCDRVRVMPFLDGIPCSVHGVVLGPGAAGTAALRPVEMVVLRRPAGHPEEDRFCYASTSTWWDPPDADRAVMREVARRVGSGLHERVGYRGGFGVDGVMTADGFVPTELNPRFAAGLDTVSRGVPDFPLAMVQTALVSGQDPGLSADDLEALLLPAADRHRSGGAFTQSPHVSPAGTESRRVRVTDGCVRFAAADEPEDGSLALGPSSVGGMVRLTLDVTRTRPGPSAGARAVAAFALADATWGTGIGPVLPAPSLRRDVRQEARR